MTEFKLSIYKGRIYLKEELRNILGSDKKIIRAIADARTVLLFPEDAQWNEIRESVNILLSDIKLREELSKNEEV